jgi:predicted SAM-dependent methyltransferase
MATKMKAEKAKADIKEVKLDLGCGPNPKEGYIGVDIIKYPNVHKVLDLTKPWPWKNNSVDEIHCSHFIEHFNSKDRAHLVC